MFRSLILLLPLFVSSGPATANGLRVHEAGRHLETTEGEPFLWVADTAWELTNRLELDEIEHYLENRAAKGFTVILTNALSHWAFDRPNVNGDIPFVNFDPEQPVEAYFAHLDRIIAMMAEREFVIGFLPTWGDKFDQREGAGPEIFTAENARAYGRYLGERYRDAPVVWVLGGDRIPQNETHYAIIDGMAAGLRESVGNRQLITYHPWGNQGSDNFFHDRDWLDFNMIQSGHYAPDVISPRLIERAYDRAPVKPVVEAEPNYEDHPINFDPKNGWFTDYEPRRAAYWAMLSGAAGTTYGHHSLWQFKTDEEEPVTSARGTWQQALDFPGAWQMKVMRDLFDSLPWSKLVPRQDLIKGFMPDPPATPRFALAVDQAEALAYSPYGLSFNLSLGAIAGRTIAAAWIDPRTGHRIEIEQFVAEDEPRDFDPPFEPARGNDWILHLRPVESRQ